MSKKSEWAEALSKALICEVEIVPPGFKTKRQIAAEMGFSESHAGEIVRRLTSCGKAEMKKIKIMTGARLFPVPHYRIKK